MTPRVKEILSWYGADNPGTLGNLARLLNHGRLAGTIGSHSELKCVSAELLKALFPMEKAVRLLGVSISGFSVGEIDRPEQMPLAF